MCTGSLNDENLALNWSTEGVVIESEFKALEFGLQSATVVPPVLVTKPLMGPTSGEDKDYCDNLVTLLHNCNCIARYGRNCRRAMEQQSPIVIITF